MAWFTAKEWKNRLVEFAGRRSLKNVSTNETTVYDVTRNEGQVSQEGDSFSATTMNDLEQRISEGFSAAEEANSQLSSETDRIRVYVGSDGKLHFVNKAGADTVIPFDSYPYPDITISGYGSDAGTTITKPYGYNFIRCDSIRGNAYIHVDGVANKVETGNILDISSASSLELDFQFASFTIYK